MIIGIEVLYYLNFLLLPRIWTSDINSFRSLANVRFIKYFLSVIAFVCGKMCLVIYFVATPVLEFEERPLGKSV